jgi:hypothetical protein
LASKDHTFREQFKKNYNNIKFLLIITQFSNAHFRALGEITIFSLKSKNISPGKQLEEICSAKKQNKNENS